MKREHRQNAPRHFAAAFLDRDGTLNKEVEYLHSSDQFEWIPGAIDSIRKLNAHGLRVIVVTNQGGIAHGYYNENDVKKLHRFMADQLAKSGARIDDFYLCPYHPGGNVSRYSRQSGDRKPGTGMFDRAIIEHAIDPTRSFMVGDKETDIIPAASLGMSTILVRTGYGHDFEPTTRADHVEDDIVSAVERILRHTSADAG